MAVKYLAGERIIGTAAEREALTSNAPHWQLLGRHSLTSAGDDLIVDELTNKPYLMTLIHDYGGGVIGNRVRFNDVSSTAYKHRMSWNGGSEATNSGCLSQFNAGTNESGGHDVFDVGTISNILNKDKMFISHAVSRNSAGNNAPRRAENTAVWRNTDSVINKIDCYNSESGDFASGSEMVVLGFDPSDTSGTSVWEELASVDLSGGVADVITASFTAKKYLWIQSFSEQTGGTITGNVTFNNDGGTNYNRRRESNGATDSTATGETSIDVLGGGTENRYLNMFVINVSNREKLVLGDIIAGVSGNNAPRRVEFVAKWTNTSAQISRCDVINTDSSGSNRYDTETSLKVWGFD